MTEDLGEEIKDWTTRKYGTNLVQKEIRGYEEFQRKEGIHLLTQ